MQEPARREGKHQQRGRRHLDKVATRKSGAFGTGLTDKKMTGGGRRRSRRDEGQVTTTSHGAAESCRKKERKRTTQGRDGRTARRHHTGILRRGVWCASRRPPLGVRLFLSLFAVSRRFSLQPSCHLAVVPLSSFFPLSLLLLSQSVTLSLVFDKNSFSRAVVRGLSLGRPSIGGGTRTCSPTGCFQSCFVRLNEFCSPLLACIH